MTLQFDEPTLSELLGDPLVRSLMRADRVDAVDAQSFKAMLYKVADRFAPHGQEAAGSIVVLKGEGAAGRGRASVASWLKTPFACSPPSSMAAPLWERMARGQLRDQCGSIRSW
jgi:hypothetical protein